MASRELFNPAFPYISPLQLERGNDDDDTHSEGAEMSGFEDEGRTSSPTSSSSSGSINTQVNPTLVSSSAVVIGAYQNIISEPHWRTKEIPNEQCQALSTTPEGPRLTCPFFKGEAPCQKDYGRLDRFKHHLQSHMAIKPYQCASVQSSRPCGATFTSIAALKQHVNSKDKFSCKDCGLEILKKNLARHQPSCQRASRK